MHLRLERLASLGLALLLAAMPVRAFADTEAAPRKVAVVITQAVGVGALADRLGAIASTVAAESGAAVLDPAASSSQLRAAGGPDPLTCGSDATCLRTIAEALGVRWVIGIGIGRFGGIYGLELRLVDRSAAAAPAGTSATWAEPGPDWEVAMREALAGVLPEELQQQRKGTLLVRANEPGELFVDGAPAGTLPLEAPVEIAAGSHEVELRGAGGSARSTVEVQPGARAEIELVLAPALDPAPPSRWTSTGKWVAGGTTLALFTGAIATHLSAAGAMDDARAQKDEGDPFASTRQDALDRLDVARLLYTAAVAAALGTAALWYFDEMPRAAPASIGAP